MEHRKDEPNDLIPCSDIPAFNFTPWNVDKQPKQLHTTQFSLKSSNVRAFKNASTNHTIKVEI